MKPRDSFVHSLISFCNLKKSFKKSAPFRLLCVLIVFQDARGYLCFPFFSPLSLSFSVCVCTDSHGHFLFVFLSLKD